MHRHHNDSAEAPLLDKVVAFRFSRLQQLLRFRPSFLFERIPFQARPPCLHAHEYLPNVNWRAPGQRYI